MDGQTISPCWRMCDMCVSLPFHSKQCFLKIFYLKGTEKEINFPSAGLLLKCPPRLGSGQVFLLGARAQALGHHLLRTQEHQQGVRSEVELSHKTGHRSKFFKMERKGCMWSRLYRKIITVRKMIKLKTFTEYKNEYKT